MSIDVLADTKRRLQRARRQVDLYDKRNDLSEHGERSKSYYLGKVSAYENVIEMIERNLTPPTAIRSETDENIRTETARTDIGRVGATRADARSPTPRSIP